MYVRSFGFFYSICWDLSRGWVFFNPFLALVLELFLPFPSFSLFLSVCAPQSHFFWFYDFGFSVSDVFFLLSVTRCFYLFRGFSPVALFSFLVQRAFLGFFWAL